MRKHRKQSSPSASLTALIQKPTWVLRYDPLILGGYTDRCDIVTSRCLC